MKNVHANKNIFFCLLENICAHTLQLFVSVYKSAHKKTVNAWENLYAKNTQKNSHAHKSFIMHI